MTETEKIKKMLRGMSSSDLIACTTDPCDGCEAELCTGTNSCGFYEDDETGLRFGPAQVKAELQRRKGLSESSLLF